MSLPDLQYVVPFFQPIVSADNLEVFAYEVLAREARDGKVKSLGPFFEDPHVCDADKLKLDQHVRALALKRFAESGSSAKLFLNLKPSWIAASEQKDSHSVLPLLDALSLDPNNIVIEVTEEELLSDLDAFSRILVNYRRRGCLLAIDDFGKGASSIERIACVTPDIVKIDSSIVQRMDSQRSFFDICKAMAGFGDISGFDLLFEGVETVHQLERCVATRGRYLQGYIFSKARENMDTGYENRDFLKGIVSIGHYRHLVHVQRRNEFMREIEQTMKELQSLIPKRANDALDDPDALLTFAKALPHYCVRCFICDTRGQQISRLYRLGLGGSVEVSGDSGSSWFLRSFFAQGLGVLHSGNPSYLSDVYRNVATKESVATYMHALTNGRLLCVDVMSSALS